MKKTYLAALLFAGLAIAPASAADLAPGYTKAPPLAPVYSWTGFYVGGNLGGGMASSGFTDPCFYRLCASAAPTGGFFTGGVQAGYNYQFGHGLVGIEADVNGNGGFKNSVIGGAWVDVMTGGIKADVSGTIRARAGLVVNDALFYVTGGAAWADINQTGVQFNNDVTSPASFGSPTGYTANAGGVAWGGVIGAGVEYALSPNWTVGGEFLHTMYQDRDAHILDANGASGCGNFAPAANCVVRGQLTTDVARIRFNYRFGDPVVAQAADAAPAVIYRKAPATAVYSWTGFYIGGNAGGGIASSAFTDPCLYCSNATPTGGFFTGGGQIGYNYQFGNGLVGIEADINGNSGFKNSVIGGYDSTAMTVGIKADTSGTIRARGGVVVNNALVYVTGGAAWANVNQTGVDFNNDATSSTLGQPTGLTANGSGVIWGGVIGAGVEYALSPNWTVGGEFLHTMYQDRGANALNPDGTSACSNILFTYPASGCVIRAQLTTDVARVRVNYKFGGPMGTNLMAMPYAPAVTVYNWTGFHIGGNIGGGVAASRFDDTCYYCSSATPTGGFFTGGGQIGYDYQFGKGLVGFEADANANSAFKDSLLGGNEYLAMRVGAKADLSGTIRGRAGLVVDNALVYATGGAAWADVRQTGTEFNNVVGIGFGTPTGLTANRSGVVWGGVIGAGVEFAISSDWTVGGEFLHTMYQDRDANILESNGASACYIAPAANCVIHNQLTTDVARLRFNYKFAQ